MLYKKMEGKKALSQVSEAVIFFALTNAENMNHASAHIIATKEPI